MSHMGLYIVEVRFTTNCLRLAVNLELIKLTCRSLRVRTRDIKSGLVGEIIHRFADYVFRESKAPVSDESGVENCCM